MADSAHQTLAKNHAAHAAMRYLTEGMIVGVGTGSTVNLFIAGLTHWRDRIAGAVSSSDDTTARLQAVGIRVFDLNNVTAVPIYIDGADEANHQRELIKGGGAALTREKILAAAADRFICIVDDTKLVGTLGQMPLPVEVIPMARTWVARQLSALGGRPAWRQHVTTDNGNHILDVHGLEIRDPRSLESAINQIPGVVTAGLFAARPADVLVVGTDQDFQTI